MENNIKEELKYIDDSQINEVSSEKQDDFDYTEINEPAPEIIALRQKISGKVTDDLVKEAIRNVLGNLPLIKQNQTLILSVYNILKDLYVNDVNVVLLEAPTGIGKSIIGYLLHFCTSYILCKLESDLDPVYTEDGVVKFRTTFDYSDNVPPTYFLTSSKMLQEQIDSDLTRFNFRDYMSMLKGPNNYPCNKLMDEQTSLTKVFISFSERYCIGMKKPEKEALGCLDKCEYINQRMITSTSDCAILNYSYFLNCMRSGFKPFFPERFLTIADEGHLIPEVVCSQFNYELTSYLINRIHKTVTELKYNFSNTNNGDTGIFLKLLLDEVNDARKLFNNKLFDFNLLFKYFNTITSISKKIHVMVNGKIFEGNTFFEGTFKKHLNKLNEDAKLQLDNVDILRKLHHNRKGDLYYISELVSEDHMTGLQIFKHIIRDLSEASLVNRHFLNHTAKCLIMSATLGDVDEFASLIGLKKGEYKGYRCASPFDFTESPIYLCKSGFLNYNNFASNIDKVLLDTINICEKDHAKDKGIIHTSTFGISEKLKTMIYTVKVKNPNRYLFYSNSDEKEECINKMKSNDSIPYVIVGPSLYEGIDLKDDFGRFNILVKVPYAGLSDYLKRKIERYPFWYERNTKEKIIQAIGRTNRHTKDYSKIYLMDSMFDKIIFNCPDLITKRLQYKKIY